MLVLELIELIEASAFMLIGNDDIQLQDFQEVRKLKLKQHAGAYCAKRGTIYRKKLGLRQFHSPGWFRLGLVGWLRMPTNIQDIQVGVNLN